RLWEVKTGREIHCFESGRVQVHAVAFSPDGRHVLSGHGDGTARIWDVETGKELRRFVRHRQRVTAVAFAQGGRWAISGSHDGTVRWWDSETGRPLGIGRDLGKVQSITVTRDGHRVQASTLDGEVRLLEISE